jgi:multifunctional 2-oxoglutarate metabolism enzyme
MFLKRVHELLLGEDGLLRRDLPLLDVPYEAVSGARRQPDRPRRGDAREADGGRQLINMHRVRGHLIADLDPLRWKEPHMHAELDPATYGLTIWDLDREFLTGGGISAAATR